jgi:4-hydroxy 2-oxovalerate aldolase
LINKTKINILDTTLRDGSYTIDYQFSFNDTQLIAYGLEQSLVDYIEIGHGLGLGGGKVTQQSVISDLQYMKACNSILTKSKFGFFCIPKIAKLSDLKKLKDNGGSFIRLGVELRNINECFKFINYSNKIGLDVWVNFMKTHSYNHHEFYEIAKKFMNYNINGIYIVDSAGSMLPDDVKYYMDQLNLLKNETNVNFNIGFHGHDNLLLSSSCSLTAAQNGANFIDGSLLGIGRSAGNTPIENMVLILKKANFKTDVDPWKLFNLSEKMIRPLIKNRIRNSYLEKILGYTNIHDGFLPQIKSIAKSKNKGMIETILNLDEALKFRKKPQTYLFKSNYSSRSKFYDNFINENLNIDYKYLFLFNKKIILNYFKKIINLSLKRNIKSCILITGPWQKKSKDFIKLQDFKTNENLVLGTIETNSHLNFKKILNLANNEFDYILLDHTKYSTQWTDVINKSNILKSQSKILPYNDRLYILHYTALFISSNTKEKNIYIAANEEDFSILKDILESFGKSITNYNKSKVWIIIDKFDFTKLDNKINNVTIYDIAKKNIKKLFLKKSKDINIVKIDFSVGIIHHVSSIISSFNHNVNIVGKRIINSIEIVSGGYIAKFGSIIVDNYKDPTKILGVADGYGNLKSNLTVTDKNNIKKINKFILKKFFDNSNL